MQKRILIIEDDDAIADGLQIVFKDVGYSVILCQEAENIQKIALAKKPHLILLDYLIGGVDGTEICKQLKKHKQTKNIPIIMISAHMRGEASAQECGADHFLPKPFDMQELLLVSAKYAGAKNA